MSDRPTMVCSYCGFRHPWDRDNFPDRSVSMCVDCSTEAKDRMKEPKVTVATIRDVIGRAIYRLGAALCTFAGRWDADTDRYENGRGH